MGHQVEYLLEIDPHQIRRWLAQFDGFWIEPTSPDELPSGEFCLWGVLWVHADLAMRVCWLRVPQIKYSWLIAQHPESVTQIQRLECLLVENFPDAAMVRVDELLRLQWEQLTGQSWAQLNDAVGSLQRWLASSGENRAHFRVLLE